MLGESCVSDWASVSRPRRTEVVPVGNADVHALPALRRVRVAGVADDEHAPLLREARRYALPDYQTISRWQGIT